MHFSDTDSLFFAGSGDHAGNARLGTHTSYLYEDFWA